MTEEAEAAEKAVHRFSKAVISMDIAQLMNDLMPDAMMKLQDAAGGGMAVQITDYEVLAFQQAGEQYLSDVKYLGPTNFTARLHWGNVGGEWKIVDAEVLSQEGI